MSVNSNCGREETEPQVLERIDELKKLIATYRQGIRERIEKIKVLEQEITEYEVTKKKLEDRKNALQIRKAIIESD